MVRNIFNTFITRLSSSLLNLLLAIYISNVSGPGVRGEQSLILTTITLIALLTAVVGSGSILYLTPRRNGKHLLVPAYTWSLLICLLVYIFLALVPVISKVYVLPVCLLTLILSFSHIHASMLMGIEKIRYSNLVILVNSMCVLIFLLLFTLVLKMEMIRAYLFALFAGYLAGYLLSLFYMLKCWKLNFVKREVVSSYRIAFFDLIRYGILNQLDVITSMLSFRFSYYLIDHYLGKDSLGVYSNAISIIESIWLISRSIAMVQNARIANRTDLHYSVRITANLLKISFLLIFCVVLIILLIPSVFYQFIFGSEFGEMRSIMLYISPGILFFSISFIISGLFSGTGKYAYNTISSSAGLVVTIVSAFLLIPKFGLAGAGISATLAYIISSLVRLGFLLKKFPVTAKQLIPGAEDFRNLKAYILKMKG
jgi:O-antigen/teichoic acid export membrane protein